MTSDEIAKLVIDTGSYVNANKRKDGKISTPSGEKVAAYLSCRLAISDVVSREKIEENLIERIEKEFKSDVTIIGMATAGITWAHAIASKFKLPLLYIRSSEKGYGLKGLIEGDINKAFKKAIIVDDVLYTGETISKAQEILKGTDIRVVGVACIATLNDKSEKKLNELNIRVISLTNYKNILKKAKDKELLNDKEYIIMKNIYEKNL